MMTNFERLNNNYKLREIRSIYFDRRKKERMQRTRQLEKVQDVQEVLAEYLNSQKWAVERRLLGKNRSVSNCFRGFTSRMEQQKRQYDLP